MNNTKTNLPSDFLSSDAWILLAIIYSSSERPSPLVNVIATADFIDHAIVTFEEMDGALSRLQHGKFIIYRDALYSATIGTLQYFNQKTKARRPVRKDREDIEKYLNSKPWDPSFRLQDANIDSHFAPLTRDIFDDAVQEYLSWHPKLTGVTKKKIKKKEPPPKT